MRARPIGSEHPLFLPPFSQPRPSSAPPRRVRGVAFVRDCLQVITHRPAGVSKKSTSTSSYSFLSRQRGTMDWHTVALMKSSADSFVHSAVRKVRQGEKKSNQVEVLHPLGSLDPIPSSPLVEVRHSERALTGTGFEVALR
ncbi:hypothetical protein B0H19DRAFT_134672 [Mycena capillaripes]|nr:hypothetical protein B0H19DRAFT_134672 [Mycena capillaripes]